MSLAQILSFAALGLAGSFFLAWVVQRRLRDAAVVDVAWTLSFAPLSVFYALALGSEDPGSWLVVALVCAWSLRLGLHLLRSRILSGRPEDGRYAELRKAKGARADAWFFGFFQAQALSVLVLSASILGVLLDPPASLGVIVAGTAVFATSIVGEAVADAQLQRFRSDPANRGRVCRVGLWSVSRHPNYFFEWLHWMSYPVFAFGGSYAWLTWIAPPVMLLLMTKVTGIPPTEAQAIRTRGDAYREYQRTTSAFFPWFPIAGSESRP
jgi:steroid 5-alpha reductase family enzyme